MNVLVADDDRMSREMLRRIIESDQSYTCALASDGEEAWKLLCEPDKHFDVGIFDINMPRVDGLRLIERMRATPSLRSMPAILCTAAADRTTVAKASTLAVSHYIIKPYSKSLVLDKLQIVRGEIARSRMEKRETTLQRLGMDDETYRILANALLAETQRWLQLVRFTSDASKIAKLASRAAGLRGACTNFGLSILAARLTEVESTVLADSAAASGQPSPFLLAQMAPIFEQLEQELAQTAARIASPA